MFDPYHLWLAIPKAHRPPTYYQLLGVAPEETEAEVIREAAIRQTTHLRTYQSGPHAEDCARLLSEIALARKTLLDPELRRAYDAHLGPPPAPGILPGAPDTARPGQAPDAVLLQRSLQQVLEQGDKLVDLFYYTVFLKRYPEVAPYFETVNFQHQGALLAMALMAVVYHSLHPCPATRLYLRYLGKKHQARGVPAALYPKWRDALLDTLAELHGKGWSESLAVLWGKAIERAAEEMLKV
jgi:hemoglobin-like flavoprotein